MKPLAVILASIFISGCASHISQMSDKENIWVQVGDGATADLYYCMARIESKLADPACFKAKLLSTANPFLNNQKFMDSKADQNK